LVGSESLKERHLANALALLKETGTIPDNLKPEIALIRTHDPIQGGFPARTDE